MFEFVEANNKNQALEYTQPNGPTSSSVVGVVRADRLICFKQL
jgi:hypothetical protein